MTNINSNDTCIGIDIGERNMAFTIISDNTVIKHYHYDLTRGYTFRSFKLIHSIIYNMLNEIIFNNYNNSINILIEDQISKNRACSTIQTIIETILFMKEYRYTRVNPRKKYANIKMIIGKSPAKKDLQKYFQISNELVTYKQYNISTNTFDVYNNTLFKYDDLIDSYLIATCI